jgi:hypothetical protein
LGLGLRVPNFRICLHLAVFLSTAKPVELLIISNLLGLPLDEIY